MRILVTGVTGFVGSHMTDRLLDDYPEAHIFASKRWRSREVNVRHILNNERVHFIESDLLDRGSLHKLIDQSRPDYVFHFAAQSCPSTSFKYPVKTLMTNGVGTTNLLEEITFAREAGKCDPVIISVSSSEVYGVIQPEDVPVKETTPFRAANPYSISKTTHDLMSQYFQKSHGLKIIITRMFSHEGSRRGSEFALSSFAKQIASNEIFHKIGFQKDFMVNVGNLESVRTYAHIDDAIDAYCLAATKGKIGEIYNIGGEDTFKVGEVLDMMLEKSKIPKSKQKIKVDPERLRPTDITLQIPDCTKFKKDTGWKPKKNIQDIVFDMLNYWREQINYDLD